jgi:uncharacterized protein
MKRFTLAVLALTFWLAACIPAAPAPVASPTPAPGQTPAPTASPAPSATPSLSPTPDPYREVTIDHLRARTYGGGQVEIVEQMAVHAGFTRYLIRYPSDGLTIYGFMNVPHGEGPFPVVIALHGYIDPAVYHTLDYTTRYADALARAGYLVLHPNLRGYPPSDSGDNLFRVGMAIDVLNLIALVGEHGGREGALQAADPGRIGLWGHSMGGGIVTRVLTVSDRVQAAVLYGAMSGDEYQNHMAILGWSGGSRGREELTVPAADLARISPVYFFEHIQAAVSIHHGTADGSVPVEWSRQTCDRLIALGKLVECHFYDGLRHTFSGAGDQLFVRRVQDFFATYLSGR